MIHPAPSVTRRALLGAGAAVPAAVAVAACGSDDEPGPAGELDQVTFLTNFGQLGRDSYGYVAIEKGFFAEENIEATIEAGFGTGDNFGSLLDGTADFVVVDSAGAVIIASEMSGFRAIAAIHQVPLIAVMAYRDTGIENPGAS
jgi:NitT/TauT family transport system substrate-binding protein